MATRLFSTLEYKIAPVAPGCPIPTIIHHVRDAAIDVCKRTLLWRYTQEYITLTAGVYAYDYDVPDGSEVASIIHARTADGDITPMTQEEAHRRFPQWPSTDATTYGDPHYTTQFNPGQFCLIPIPDDSKIRSITMFLALKPARDSLFMDRLFFDEAEPLILHGALHTLLALPNKSWSSQELSSFHAKQFAYKTGVQRAESNIGMGRASLSVQMQPF
jgi:hypothetical protein